MGAVRWHGTQAVSRDDPARRRRSSTLDEQMRFRADEGTCTVEAETSRRSSFEGVIAHRQDPRSAGVFCFPGSTATEAQVHTRCTKPAATRGYEVIVDVDEDPPERRDGLAGWGRRGGCNAYQRQPSHGSSVALVPNGYVTVADERCPKNVSLAQVAEPGPSSMSQHFPRLSARRQYAATPRLDVLAVSGICP